MNYRVNCTSFFCLILFLVLFGVVGIYYVIDPSEATWFPKCMFHEITGLECPACGNQRALHALLHGNIKSAFSYNPLFVISLPYLFLLLISAGSTDGKLKRIKNVVQNHKVVLTYLILICVWWVVRNCF